jgi:phosphonate transport system substrate-binding protein
MWVICNVHVNKCLFSRWLKMSEDMRLFFSPNTTRLIGRRLAFIGLLGLLAACTDTSDPKVIDFGNTIPVARPGERAPVQPEKPVLRVAVGAMVSPGETFVHYRQLLDYLGDRLGMNVELIQRKTYSEVNELVGDGRIDLAFICSGPYATGKAKYGFDLLATPEVQGSHFYHSYLIVNRNSSIEHLEDLKGKVFAFTDPDSHTGKLVPTHWLAEINQRPESFFGKLIYTYSHDNSILAVAKGLVDGAAVDGLIWEFYQHRNPSLTAATRVIRKSEPFGIPPVVASGSFSPELKELMRKTLLAMHEAPEGRRILAELMIDRFVASREEWYDSIRQLEQKLAAQP